MIQTGYWFVRSGNDDQLKLWKRALRNAGMRAIIDGCGLKVWTDSLQAPIDVAKAQRLTSAKPKEAQG